MKLILDGEEFEIGHEQECFLADLLSNSKQFYTGKQITIGHAMSKAIEFVVSGIACGAAVSAGLELKNDELAINYAKRAQDNIMAASVLLFVGFTSEHVKENATQKV